MLAVTVPENDRRGQVRINGQTCDFRVEVVMVAPLQPQGWFWFRKAGKGQPKTWDKRKILTVHDGQPGFVMIHCADADGTGMMVTLDAHGNPEVIGGI